MEENRYLNLLKLVLTDYHRINLSEYKPIYKLSGVDRMDVKYTIIKNLLYLLNKLIRNAGFNLAVCRVIKPDPAQRREGLDWPANAETMVGLKRLENILYCISEIFYKKVPGDLIETGVWRGGASIFMKAVLNELGDTNRMIWLADSFAGLPKPNVKEYPEDKGDASHIFSELAVPIETVKYNFEKFNLLDDRVRFLKGWFKDTLPIVPVDKWSLIRLDGDLYESTWDGLSNLYPKLSQGGFIIIDDWTLPGCKKAVLDYRAKFGINEEILPIDSMSIYWRKA